MNERFEGWETKEKVYIPPVKRKGFCENIIIRKTILPEDEYLYDMNGNSDETVLAENSYIGEDETVFASVESYCLILKRMKTKEQIIVSSNEFMIGKQVENDYVIKDNPMISRKHARIYCKNHEFWLEDLNSLNHTYVNDKTISKPVRLMPGMKFRMSLDEEFEVVEITEN